MPYFESTEDVYRNIGGLFDWAKTEQDLGTKLKATGLIIRMIYHDPEAVITIDCANPPKEQGTYVSWYRGDGGLTPEVTFEMKSDVAHRFWLGKVNLLIALTKRDIKAAGPITKVMKILPLLKPLYAAYPKILEKNGCAELVNV